MTLQQLNAPHATLSDPLDQDLETNGQGENGSLQRRSTRLPRARKWSLGVKLAVLVIVLVVVGSGGATGWYYLNNQNKVRTDIITKPIRKAKLPITVVERGMLESAKNNDVICSVKARSQGSTVASTIKWVIDDGSHVKKGDLLAELDDSGLQETLKEQRIKVDRARADWIAAEEEHKITLSQNESDIKTAEVTIELKELDLKQYVEGDYQKELKDIMGRMKTSESDLEQFGDRKDWSDRMVQKGYVTKAAAESDKNKHEAARLALEKIKEELRVLQKFTYVKTVKERENNLAEAKRSLDRVKTQTKAKEVKARTDRDSKKSVLDQETSKMQDLEEEIKKCKLYSPDNGLVVYFVSEQTRGGFGSQQSIVAQGEPVREGQKLMRIPDLRNMQVNTKIHEALISRVKGEMRDAGGKLIFGGLPARVKVDAFSDRELKGHVRTVATVAANQDWFSADVKTYQTIVSIDEPVEGLKPGMSAEVSILVDHTNDEVLIIPVQAIVGTPSMGAKRACWVKTGEGKFEEREIEIGGSNERDAEVRSGVKEGEEVVLDPKVLEKLGYKSKLSELGDRASGSADQATWGDVGSLGADAAKAEAKLKSQNQSQQSSGGSSPADGKTGGKGKGGFGGKGFNKEAFSKMSAEEKQAVFKRMYDSATPEQKERMRKRQEQQKGGGGGGF